MWIAEIWRYPVKSMRGERLDRAMLGAEGVEGDRQLVVRLPNGAIATARRYPRLLTLAGSTGPDGEALVDGRRWNSAEIGERIEAVTRRGPRAGRRVTLRHPAAAGRNRRRHRGVWVRWAPVAAQCRDWRR